jgi:hypothetical protein
MPTLRHRKVLVFIIKSDDIGQSLHGSLFKMLCELDYVFVPELPD